jgi:uncharacterized protein (DUF2132 family)
MSEEQPDNKLHGISLEQIVTERVAQHSWPELASR